MTRGHVFVVHSRMEDLDFDAAIIPTDDRLSVRSYWQPVLRVPPLANDPDHLDTRTIRPTGWPQPFAAIPVHATPGPNRPMWFIQANGPDLDTQMANISGLLREISASQLKPGPGRSNPLVVLNPLGVGGGGFGAHRGAVIDRLLEVCHEFASQSEVDLAITTPESADYAALQSRRRSMDLPFPTLSPQLWEHAERLAKLAREGHLALFLGAGVSIPAGLPSWDQLLNKLQAASGTSKEALHSLDSPLDQAELLKQNLGGNKSLQHEITQIFSGNTLPGLSHMQLAALRCGQVITTNYDSLYEAAANATRSAADPIRVLPFEQEKPFQDWILKMHGDIAHSSDIVLSRSDFVGYSNSAGPVGAIVQALMLTKHLLVVGTSLTDDNFLRLAYEVTNYLSRAPVARDSGPSLELGTVLNLQDEPGKRELWEGTFTVLSVTEGPATIQEQARAMSILLDAIAMLSAGHDWLLDDRYSALLGKEEAKVVRKLNEILPAAQRLAREQGADSGWQVLAEVLDELGARLDPTSSEQ